MALASDHREVPSPELLPTRGSRHFPRPVMRLRWLLAAALALALAAFGAAAASRPYADNQRNWLIVAAVLSGLALAVIVLARSLAAGAKAVVSEWKPRK